MKTYLVLRILRSFDPCPIDELNPWGEEISVRIFPIFSPILANSAAEALEKAREAYPLFRFCIAVQEKRSYDYHAFRERERIRRLRAGGGPPPGGKDSSGRPQKVH